MGWNSVLVNEGYVCEFKNASSNATWPSYERFGHAFVDDRSSLDLGQRCLMKTRFSAVANAMVDVYDFSSALGYYLCWNGTGIREGPPL